MKVSASVKSSFNDHQTTVQTNGNSSKLQITPKLGGYGSSVNGGELLMLSLATCYCNDIYREAANRNITVTSVEVEVSGEFGAAGEAGSNFTYKAAVSADASPAEIEALLKYTDEIAEIHKTLRRGINITLLR